MVVDAVRTYLDAANGLTELSRRDAVAAARALLRSDGRTVGAAAAEGEAAPRVGQSIQALAGELIETSQANRSAIADLVREEVGRQLQSMDLVPRDEHERLARRVSELERRLAARHAVERALVVNADAPGSPSSADRDERGDEAGPRSEPAAPAPEPEPAAPDEEGSVDDEGSEVRGQDASEGEDAPQETAEDLPEDSSEADGEARTGDGTAQSAHTSVKPAARSTAASGSTRTSPAKTTQAKPAKGKSAGKRTTKAKTKK